MNFKIFFKEEARRFSSEKLSLPLLQQKAALFELQQPIRITYTDDEGDKVLISTEEELQEALRLLSDTSKTLRFDIHEVVPVAVNAPKSVLANLKVAGLSTGDFSVEVTHPADTQRPLKELQHQQTLDSNSEVVEFGAEYLAEQVAMLSSNDSCSRLASAQTLRIWLSVEVDPPIQEIIDAGVVPKLVQFVSQQDDVDLQFEAAWALTNIASGTSNHIKAVVDAGAVPALVKALGFNDKIREQAAWALGNITSGDSIEYRDLVLSYATVPALVQLATFVESCRLSTVRIVAWTLLNLCKGNPAPDLGILRPALPLLRKLILLGDEETLSSVCWTLSCLSDASKDHIKAFMNTGVCYRLVELLTHASAAVQAPALLTVGNILSENDRHVPALINSNLLPVLLKLLEHPEEQTRKRACWTVSNITAGTSEHIQHVIEAGMFPRLIKILQADELNVKREAAWAIANATSRATYKQAEYLVEHGVAEALRALLEIDDSSLIAVALGGLENIELRYQAEYREEKQDSKCNLLLKQEESEQGFSSCPISSSVSSEFSSPTSTLVLGNAVEYSSWLLKVGLINKSTRRRLFVLKNGMVSYYAPKSFFCQLTSCMVSDDEYSEYILRGTFPVTEIEYVSVCDPEGRFIFRTPKIHGGSFKLEADSTQTAAEWADAIRRAKMDNFTFQNIQN